MVKIKFYTKKGCIACNIMRDILVEIMRNYEGELTFENIPCNQYDELIEKDYVIDKFPSIVIMDNTNTEDYVIIEGTNTKKNVEAVINKFKNYDRT